MLSVANRLKKKKDFGKVFEKGEGYRLPRGRIYLKIKKNNLANSRFGFVVSKQVSKKATVRNKIRRRLKEVVKMKIPEIKKGIDGVIVVIPGLEKKDFSELKEEINKLFKKAGIIK